jgi:hypothetical protein
MTQRRNQPALVLDELDAIVPRFDPARAPSAQAIEELARLGSRIFEAAALLALELEANGGPRLAKGLQAQVKTEPLGLQSPSDVDAAVERDPG